MQAHHNTQTPANEKDCWATPEWLFSYLDQEFDFDVDLACTPENKKCLVGYYDSLLTEWNQPYKRIGFCNPPYSDIGPWLKKAFEESKNGFTSVLLIPTPDGQSYFRDYVFGKAAELRFINGRIAFEASETFKKKVKKTIDGEKVEREITINKGDEVDGNNRGSCIVIFKPNHSGNTALNWIDRDEIKEAFKK